MGDGLAQEQRRLSEQTEELSSMIYKRYVVETVMIKELFTRLGVEDKEHATVSVKFPLEVKTPYGYKRIRTAFRTEKQQSITTYFKNNKTLKTSGHHLLKANGDWKKVKDITTDDVVETETGTTSIARKHVRKKLESLYDISVEDVHCYYSNGILSHNSWCLARLGCEAIKAGKNVIHFTFELNENYVGLRYDACFTGIPFQDIREHVDTVKEKLNNPDYGKLFIKYFPLKTANAQMLKMYIDRVQMLKGVKIDMVVVDYADLMIPLVAQKNANAYTDAGNVYEELRTVAGELQIPVWSASQSNREGAELDIIKAHNVADSYRKVMTGDFVASLGRKTDDKTSNTARIHVIKNRFGADGMTFPSTFDASNGTIKIYDATSTEGRDLSQKMQTTSEDNTKDKMLGVYNKMSRGTNKNWNSGRSRKEENGDE
jgi:hypothetical protein